MSGDAAPRVPDMSSSVGWKGLLEMSRTSGAAGVVGVQRSPEDDGRMRDGQIEVCATAHTNAAIRRLVKSVTRGLRACQEPEKTAEGMGGTYFFCNENGRKVAILKPCDEEPLAPNNPKGYVGRSLGDPGWKPTVRVGEAAMREVAAYLLDRDGFAKVPTSVLVRARHPIFCYNTFMGSVRASIADLGAIEASMADGALTLPMKLGSMQEFVQHECDTTEMGPSKFSKKDVHRIGIMDIRLFNTDRHAGNMLVRSVKDFGSTSNLLGRMSESQYELVPIDHGFCLPETLEAPYFEWLHWPQAMLPFSEEEIKYIRDLDIEADKALLRQELPNLRPECIRVLELTTALLKRCVEAGMTLFEIGNLMSRPFVDADEDPSELEKCCEAARRALEIHEIAEGDEGSSEDGFEEDCNEDEGEEAIVQELAEELFEGREKLNSLRSSFKDDEHNMLFELEEDAGNHIKALMVASSPTQFSVGSSISISSINSPETPVVGASSLLPNIIRNMAQSVHVADGLLRHMESHRRQQRSKQLQKPSKRRAATKAQVYTPVMACGSQQCITPINFGDFDDKGWVRFQHELMRLIDDSICEGKWRQDKREATCGGIAMSCPRF